MVFSLEKWNFEQVVKKKYMGQFCNGNVFFFFVLFCLSNLNNQVKYSNRVWKCQYSLWGYTGLRIVVFSFCNVVGDKIFEIKDDN